MSVSLFHFRQFDRVLVSRLQRALSLSLSPSSSVRFSPTPIGTPFLSSSSSSSFSSFSSISFSRKFIPQNTENRSPLSSLSSSFPSLSRGYHFSGKRQNQESLVFEEAEILEVDETKLKQEEELSSKSEVRNAKDFGSLAKAIWKIFDEDDHLVVHPASLHSLISFVKTDSELSQTIKILKEAQMRCIELSVNAANDLMTLVLKKGDLDLGVNLLHRTRRMAKYHTGDPFVYRVFPEIKFIHQLFDKIVEQKRDDLFVTLVRIYRGRYSPHVSEIANVQRRYFYHILLKWLRANYHEEVDELVQEILDAKDLSPEKSDELLTQMCAVHIFAGRNEEAFQLGRLGGGKELQPLHVFDRIVRGDVAGALAYFAENITSSHQAKRFVRLFYYEVLRVDQATVQDFVNGLDNLPGLAPEGEVCVERCKRIFADHLEKEEEKKAAAGNDNPEEQEEQEGEAA